MPARMETIEAMHVRVHDVVEGAGHVVEVESCGSNPRHAHCVHLHFEAKDNPTGDPNFIGARWCISKTALVKVIGRFVIRNPES